MREAPRTYARSAKTGPEVRRDRRGSAALESSVPKSPPYGKIGHTNPYHTERRNRIFRREKLFFPL